MNGGAPAPMNSAPTAPVSAETAPASAAPDKPADGNEPQSS